VVKLLAACWALGAGSSARGGCRLAVGYLDSAYTHAVYAESGEMVRSKIEDAAMESARRIAFVPKRGVTLTKFVSEDSHTAQRHLRVRLSHPAIAEQLT
jgi:hypothetical protein